MAIAVGVETVQAEDLAVAGAVLRSVRPMVETWSIRRNRAEQVLGLRVTVVRAPRAVGVPSAHRAAAVSAVLRAALRLRGGQVVNVGAAGVCGRRLWMPVLAGWSRDELQRWLEWGWGRR